MEIQEQFKCFNWCIFDNVKIEIKVVELAVQLQPEKAADYSFLKKLWNSNGIIFKTK